MAANSSLGSFRSQSWEKSRVLALLLALASGLFTLSCVETGQGVLATIQGGVQVVVSPVRYLGAIATLPFQGLSNAVINLTASEASLTELREENERLMAENATLKEAQQTAERLEGLLGVQSTFNLESIGARVISQSSDSANSTITLDKGSLAGLEVDMPVTDSFGVVGQIIECSPTTSVVRLISDERSGVAAMVQESRAHGEIAGSADGMLRLELVSAAQTVEVNDLVITSGLGGVYPKGLPIGVVSNVTYRTGDLYQTIQVKPLAQVGAFEEVLVITDVNQEQLAKATDAADAQNQEILREGNDEAQDESATTNEDGGSSSSPSDDQTLNPETSLGAQGTQEQDRNAGNGSSDDLEGAAVSRNLAANDQRLFDESGPA